MVTRWGVGLWLIGGMGSMLPKALHNTIESIARFYCIGNRIAKCAHALLLTFISFWQVAIGGNPGFLANDLGGCYTRDLWTHLP